MPRAVHGTGPASPGARGWPPGRSAKCAREKVPDTACGESSASPCRITNLASKRCPVPFRETDRDQTTDALPR